MFLLLRKAFVAVSLLFGIVLFCLAKPSAASREEGGDTGVIPGVVSSEEAEKLERGRYLVSISSCASCHTQEGGAPFAGGVEFKTPFGAIHSTNISQNPETGIGSWSFEDFKRSMREGTRPDGTHLYPVFPYTNYTRFTDDDLQAIYRYLRTVEPVEAVPFDNVIRFPYNLNFLLGAWKFLFLDEGEYIAQVDKKDEWNRGAYLVKGALHCGMCHTPRNFLGAEVRELAYSGSTYLDRIRDGQYRTWAATNLTSSPRGLGHWSKDDIVSYLTTGLSERAVTFGPMSKVIMDATRHLREEDAQAVATYLQSLPALEPDSASKASEEILREGARHFTVHCGTCHLGTGTGGNELGVPLVGSSVVQASDPASLINVILYGPEIPPFPFDTGRMDMKPFGDKLRDEEVAQVASYVRASWGNDAGAVSVEQVKAQR